MNLPLLIVKQKFRTVTIIPSKGNSLESIVYSITQRNNCLRVTCGVPILSPRQRRSICGSSQRPLPPSDNDSMVTRTKHISPKNHENTSKGPRVSKKIISQLLGKIGRPKQALESRCSQLLIATLEGLQKFLSAQKVAT